MLSAASMPTVKPCCVACRSSPVLFEPVLPTTNARSPTMCFVWAMSMMCSSQWKRWPSPVVPPTMKPSTPLASWSSRCESYASRSIFPSGLYGVLMAVIRRSCCSACVPSALIELSIVERPGATPRSGQCWPRARNGAAQRAAMQRQHRHCRRRSERRDVERPAGGSGRRRSPREHRALRRPACRPASIMMVVWRQRSASGFGL